MYICLFMSCIGLCLYINWYLQTERESVLKWIVDANNLFCIQYLLFSCPFLFLEKFAVWKPLVCVLIIDIIVSVIWPFPFYKLNKKHSLKKVEKSEVILLLLIIFCSIPLIKVTSEDIGTVSDQGTYFLHSILLVEEKCSEIHEVKEMGSISSAVDEGLRELQDALLIYYHREGENAYHIHSLNTWCTLPALFGKMFGLWKIMRAVTYLYILIVLNMYYLCEKIAVNKYNVYLSMGLFAMSPLVLYIGKAGLTEVAVLYLFIVGFRNILLNRKRFYLIAGICVGLVGFIHISMIIYMPIITGMALLESAEESKKDIAYFNIVQLLMFACSLWYDYKISPIYVEKQYERFSLDGKVSYYVIFAILSALAICIAIYQLKMIQSQRRYINIIKTFIYRNFRFIVIIILTIIAVRTIYYTYFLCFTDRFAIPDGFDAGSWNLRSRYVNTGITAASYLNVVNIARATGIIGMIFFLVIPFRKEKISNQTKKFYLIGLYGIFFFTVVQMDTPFNYYASRYFIPVVVPMITITITSNINNKNWCMHILAVAFMFNRYYYSSFLEGGPQVGQYKLLQDAIEIIPKDAVVLCNPESQVVNTRLTSNLRILNNNMVYNLKNLDEVKSSYHEEMYVISESSLEIEAELILDNIYKSQYSFGNGKNGNYDMNIGYYEIPLYIYKVQ